MRLLKLTLPLFLLILSACAQLGIAKPESLDQRIAYAQGVNTAVLTASTSALRAKQISGDDHEHVIKIADQAKAILDSAVLLATTDVTAAESRLKLANTILTELQAFLNSRKGT
jgi:hypothetical protein